MASTHLRLNTATLSALSRGRYRQFVERVIHHLREHFPHRCPPEGGWAAFVEKAIVIAEKHGFETERKVVLCCNLLFVLGLELFDGPPGDWPVVILSDASLDADEKLKRMYEKAYAELRRGA
ncbi:hypothetical protein [Archangium gephyra]|nr:hypothetical protein [Archangium gephyra]